MFWVKIWYYYDILVAIVTIGYYYEYLVHLWHLCSNCGYSGSQNCIIIMIFGPKNEYYYDIYSKYGCFGSKLDTIMIFWVVIVTIWYYYEYLVHLWHLYSNCGYSGSQNRILWWYLAPKIEYYYGIYSKYGNNIQFSGLSIIIIMQIWLLE